MTMRLKLYTLLCISFLLIFTACNQDDDPVPAEKVTRTVLAYIMADNSLSGFASIDIDEMMKGMEAVDASLYNLLVYVDDASREGSQSYKFPTLYRLSKDKNGNVVKETVKEYKEQVSTDPAVMQEVLKRAFTEYPAESYGLVLWSHGEGWIPNPLPLAKQASTRWVGEDTTGGTTYGEFYQFNLSSCIRQQNSLTAQFVSFSLSNLANIFYPPPIFTIINLCLL